MYRRAVKEKKLNEWMANPRDTALLRDTWSEDFETLFTIGSSIYINAFEGEHGTASKSLFPWIAQCEAANIDYKEQNEFRIQALRLVQTIAKVLDMVDDMEKLERFLYKLGERHVKYLPSGLAPEYWDVFKDAVQTGLSDRVTSLPQLTAEDRDRAITAWTDIIEYIFDFVKEGFYDGFKGIDRCSLRITFSPE